MMYRHEVSRGPMKICYADMSRGLGCIWYLEVSSIGSWTCLTRSICYPDVFSVDVVFVVMEVSEGLLGVGCYHGVTASD